MWVAEKCDSWTPLQKYFQKGQETTKVIHVTVLHVIEITTCSSCPCFGNIVPAERSVGEGCKDSRRDAGPVC